MRAIPFLFLGLYFCTSVGAQNLDFEKLKDTCNTVYPDETLVVYNSVNTYTFHTSGNSESPIVGKLESEKLMVHTLDKHSVAIPESTNSFSLIRNVSIAKYDDNKNRFRIVTPYSSREHYESNGIFHNDFYVNVIGTLESEAGIYKLDYTKLYEDYKFLASISFSGGTATLNEVIKLEIPSWLEVDILEQNFTGFSIEKSKTTTNNGATLYTYTWKNIPKFDDEDYSPSSRYYLPHLILVYKYLDNKGNKQTLMPDASGLYAWYRSMVEEVDNQPDDLSDVVAQFQDLPKGIGQIDSVNAWVRDNIRYIAFESGIAGFKPENCQNVYNNRYGDCKGMANLCKNILVSLGYDARLVWIGTRKEVPYGYEIPSLIVDNHMITAVKLDTSFIFLDPTETYGRSDEYAYRIQGRPVLIEDDDSFILTTVPESDRESDRVNRTFKVGFDPASKSSSFVAEATYRGEPKKQILSGFNYTFAKNREEALTNYLRINKTGSFELKQTSGLDKTDDQIVIEYAFSSKEGVIDLGDEYYIDIDPTYDLENAEVTESRKAPWYFNQRYNRETEIEFAVPEGYKVDYSPESFDVVNDDFHVSVSVKEEGNVLKVDKKIQIYSGTVGTKHKTEWEDCLNKLKKYYDDRVIISKK